MTLAAPRQELPQERWLVDAISGSDATWKIWASALMMAQLVLDLREVEEAPLLLRNVFYFKLDQWDGFRSERARILSQLAGVRDLVVLSGDLHGNYAAQLRPTSTIRRRRPPRWS